MCWGIFFLNYLTVYVIINSSQTLFYMLLLLPGTFCN